VTSFNALPYGRRSVGKALFVKVKSSEDFVVRPISIVSECLAGNIGDFLHSWAASPSGRIKG
jgi:hypothetical protein